MSKAKSAAMNIFQIIFKGFLMYLKNIIPLSKVMLFPVWGQVLGVVLIFYPSFMISKKLFPAEMIQNNVVFFSLILIISVLPGFFIFAKAFWEYMVVSISLNSMTSNLLKYSNLPDSQVKSHNQAVKERSGSYITLLMVLSLIWLAAVLLPFVMLLLRPANPSVYLEFLAAVVIVSFIMFIASVYLSMSYQVFAFETLSAASVIKRSWNLVEGNFWRTLFLAAILGIATGVLVPGIFQLLASKTPAIGYVTYPVSVYTSNLIGNPEVLAKFSSSPVLLGFPSCSNPSASVLCINDLAKMAVNAILGAIITGFMLPLGSICYTLLYLDIIDRKGVKK